MWFLYIIVKKSGRWSWYFEVSSVDVGGTATLVSINCFAT